VGYGAAVEETFRYDSPLNTLMFRYAVRDVEIAGVTVREGEPVLFCLAAIGRDPQLLPDADTFRVDRVPEDVKHLAFSHGAHYCLGAPLARLEAEIALRALFERYDVSAAAARTALPRVPSLSTHSVAELPVLLTTPVLL
jgi:cytochrome P450